MTNHTKQLQAYLDDKGFDANVEWISTTNHYEIQFETTKHRTICVHHDDILTDFALVAGMIAVYKLLDRIDTDRNTCNIKRLDDDTVSIELEVVLNMRQTDFTLESGMQLNIEVTDPYETMDVTLYQKSIVPRKDFENELASKTQNILDGINQIWK